MISVTYPLSLERALTLNAGLAQVVEHATENRIVWMRTPHLARVIVAQW